MKQLQPEMDEFKKLKDFEAITPQDKRRKQNIDKDRTNLLKKHKINPLGPAVGLIIVPPLISFFMAVRNIIYNSEKHSLDLSSGVSWIPSGLVADPY